MKIIQNRIGWRFWIFWILANLAGWLLGFGVIILLALGGDEVVIMSLVSLMPVIVGILVGFAQSLVLSRYLNDLKSWWKASLIGWMIGLVGVSIVGIFFYKRVSWMFPIAMLWILPSIVAGLLQSLMLRRYSQKSFWWLLGSISGWIIGLPVFLAYPNPQQFDNPGFFIGLALATPISGGIFVWILRDQNLGLDKNAA